MAVATLLSHNRGAKLRYISAVATEDLSKLKIDRTAAADISQRQQSPRLLAMLATAAAIVLLAFFYFRSNAISEVESATVTTAYPSQSFTLLNATGYVVAQRKAAVASKATGRVEWLGVTEGSRVKKRRDHRSA